MGGLHPAIVHFAISLVIISVIFDFFGLILKKESLKNAGFWTLIVGAFAVVGAFISGFGAEELVEKIIKGTESYKRLEIHENVGKIVLVFVLILTAFRVFLTKKSDIRLMGLYLLAGFIIVAIVGLQGRIGGKLVYEYGIGVKPVMEKQLNKSTTNMEENSAEEE